MQVYTTPNNVPNVIGHATQSDSLRRACGEPCTYDHVLRTESLRDDWIALLLKTGQPDVYQLPKSNPTQVGPLGPPRTSQRR